MRKLLIFLKYPIPGQVKSRLAASLGDEAAAAIYRASAELTLSRMAYFRQEAIVCVDPPQALEQTRLWLEGGWTLRPQQGETLGERLKEATHHAFSEGARQVIVVGTDSPWLFPVDIEKAFSQLSPCDLVLGPSEDGGYYLIGLSKETHALFDGIAWGTATVFAETAARAQVLGLRMDELSRGYDLDYPEDVRRFVTEESARGHASSMVNTMAALMNERRR